MSQKGGELSFSGCPSYDAFTPIPAVRMTTGSARVDAKPTSTAAGHELLTALTLTAMGRLPKVLFAIEVCGSTSSAPLAAWRNWETRQPQKPISKRRCEFESHRPEK